MRVSGRSDREIADWLNTTGLKPRSRKYSVWSVMGVRHLFRNRFYAGWVKHRDSWTRGRHVALVSDETWARAQPRGNGHRKAYRTRALMQGLAFCSWCGTKIWTTTSGNYKGERVRWAYWDNPQSRERECGSGRRTWVVSDADEQMSSLMRGLALDRVWLRDVVREARRGEMRKGGGVRRRELEGVKGRLTDAYVSGALEESEWRRRVAAVEEELSGLGGGGEEGLVRAVRQLESFGEAWERMPLEFRREAVGAVFERVEMDMEGRVLRVEARPGYSGLLARRAEVVGLGVGPPGLEHAHGHRVLYSFEQLGIRIA